MSAKFRRSAAPAGSGPLMKKKLLSISTCSPRPVQQNKPLLLHLRHQSQLQSQSFFTQSGRKSPAPRIITRREIPTERRQRRFQSSYADPQFQNPTFAEPKQRSFAARTILATLKYGVGGLLFFLGGVYFALKELPPDTLSMALAITDKAPTNEETLSMYQPPDETSARINRHIVSHALADQLRKEGKYVEARPHMKIPEAVRKANLTGGTLAIPGGLAVPPLTFSEESGVDFVSIFYLGDQLCGHPGLVHGGMLATLLDEGLARCCFNALPNRIGVTAYLKVDYRKPVKAGSYYVLRASTQRVEGRKAWVKGWIEALDEVPSDDVMVGKPGTKLVEAEALYVEPKMAPALAKFYADST